jgi:hypothetical protein
MPARITSMFALVLLPLLMLAQAPGQPEAERALRARVTEFLQYHVDGNFRKAYDMVAADTQDDYFNTGKVQIKGFTIDDVQFSENFTKAAVRTTISRTMNVAGTDFPVMMPATTTWKLENNKWVWYKVATHTPDTPFGPSALPSATGVLPQAAADPALPKDFSDKTIADAARSILQQVSVDKNEVTLAADKASDAKVVLHNGMPGSVQVDVNAPQIPGFTAKLEQSIVRAAGNVTLLLHYEPGDQRTPRDPVNVQLTVQPLDQVFVIRVNFASPSPLK